MRLGALILVVLAALVGVIYLTTRPTHHAPVTPRAQINCLLDRDGDCPAGEPDNDGN